MTVADRHAASSDFPTAEQALLNAACHYVNCSEGEAQTGGPYLDLIDAVRTYERAALPKESR